MFFVVSSSIESVGKASEKPNVNMVPKSGAVGVGVIKFKPSGGNSNG